MKTAVYILLVSSILFGCRNTRVQSGGKDEYREALVPFSQKLKDSLNLSDEKVKSVQFYLEGNITLFLSKDERNTEVEDGIIKPEKDLSVQKVEIKNHTPGIVEKIDGSVIFIRFAQDGTNRFIAFVPGSGGIYYMAVDQRNRKIVSYDGRSYTYSPESAHAFLVVKVLERVSRTSGKRVEPGVIINDGTQ